MARTQRVPEWGEPTDVRGFVSDSSAVEPRSSRASSASSGLPCASKVSRDQSRSAACSMSGAASQDSTTEAPEARASGFCAGNGSTRSVTVGLRPTNCGDEASRIQAGSATSAKRI